MTKEKINNIIDNNIETLEKIKKQYVLLFDELEKWNMVSYSKLPIMNSITSQIIKIIENENKIIFVKRTN